MNKRQRKISDKRLNNLIRFAMRKHLVFGDYVRGEMTVETQDGIVLRSISYEELYERNPRKAEALLRNVIRKV